jgi:formate--tetrahydrofolate ligase
MPIEKKIEAIVQKIYRGKGVALTSAAKKTSRTTREFGLWQLAYLYGQDSIQLLGRCRSALRPRRLYRYRSQMTMPGLPPVPSAEKIDVDSNGKISGLF